MSGKSYSRLKTTTDIALEWDIAPEGKIYRISMAGTETWDVNKEAVVNGIKRYYVDGFLSDPEDNWVSIEGEYIVLYENAGQSKRTFSNYKEGKEDDRVERQSPA